MSREIGTIRVSQQAKEQMIKLKRVTGVKQWNVLCRWALTTSLREGGPLSSVQSPADSNVEMTWKTFAGSESEVFLALVRHRAHQEGLPREMDLTSFAVGHIHRGIGHLAGQVDRGDAIEDLLDSLFEA